MTTAGARLVTLAGPGVAGALLASIGAGTTAGSRLVAFSGLASGTAAQHLLTDPTPAPTTSSGGKVRRGRRSHGFIGLSDIAAPQTPLIKISGHMSASEAPDTFYAIGEAYESPEQIRARINSRTIALLMLV